MSARSIVPTCLLFLTPQVRACLGQVWAWGRRLLRAALCLTGVMGALTAQAQPFSLEDVALLANRLARAPYQAPVDRLPVALRELNHDLAQSLVMREGAALWATEALPFQVELMPTVRQYRHPVVIFEITAQGPRRLPFSADAFDLSASGLDAPTLSALATSPDVGYAGVRIISRLGPSLEEILSFAGATYMRGRLPGERLGASARAMALAPHTPGAQEQPRFTTLWVERPHAGDRALTLYALMDSPSVTGAYRVVLRPGQYTVADVQSRLFARQAGVQPGLVPLGGMYYYGENQPRTEPDIRPEVHDVDGLSMHTGDGQWLWRPLVNPSRLLVTSFVVRDPRGFGLMQRDRNFESYQDPLMRYEARPSVWVEPRGNWGDGRIELVQLPTPDATNENISVHWVPAEALQAGRAHALAYRVLWQADDAAGPPHAKVVQSRRGPHGEALPPGHLRFAVDFEGPAIADTAARPPVAAVSVGENGELVRQRLIRNQSTQGWRLVLQVRRVDAARPVEMRAVLQRDQQDISETWTYILPPN